MSDQPSRPYFRTPAVAPDGSRIAFVHAADIWLVDGHGGVAERLTAHPSSHFGPCWSPDGERLAFSSNRTGYGDIYILPLSGGSVQRVTYQDMSSTADAWSADGKHIFFSSWREQQGCAIYRVTAEGSHPVPWLEQPYEQLNSVAVSPDGEQLAFNVNRDRWWRRGPNPYGGSELWVVNNAPNATDFQRLSTDYIGMNRWPMWAADGKGLYFVSDRCGVENIWFHALDGSPVRKITSFVEGRVLWPTISRDAGTIVFERDFGIWRLDLASGDVAPLNIRVRGDTRITPVRVLTYGRDLSELALAPDGKKVAFIARGEVFADFADKETDKERRQGPSFRITNTSARESDLNWSPDSRSLVYTSDRHGDEEVYLYDMQQRVETRLTDSERPKHNPYYTPDGAWLAYGRGDDEVRLINTATREDRPFVRAHFPYGADFTWSPDSRWLVFIAQDERAFNNLYVQRIDEQEAHQITFLSNLDSHGPQWAANGQYIIFTTRHYRAEAQIARVDLRPIAPLFREDDFEKLFEGKESGARSQEPGGRSQEPSERRGNVAANERLSSVDDSVSSVDTRTGNSDPEAPPSEPESAPNTKVEASKPDALEIVFNGIERRLRFLTPIQMDASAQVISPDSRDLLFSASVAGKTNLWYMPLDEPRHDQAPRQLTSGSSWKWGAQFAPDGKSFYYLDGGQIVTRKFPGGEATNVQVSAEVSVDFNQEKLQIFEQCWRLLRDRFYDPTFRGLDWSAARTQFAPLAAGAQTTGDLHAILNLMVGELRASHLGAAFGGGGYVQDGYLGLLFDHVEHATSGRLIIVEILPDSPAALAGNGTAIRVNDELLAVDGVELTPAMHLDRLLQRTVGRRVRLRVGARDGETREVAVRPISADQYDTLRYRLWVHANEAYVHRVSQGRLGYVHVRSMTYDAYQQFLADLDAEAYSKEGIVVDVRFNGGGHIATFILDVLARRSVLVSGMRDRPTIDAGQMNGSRVLNKPTVLLINEGSVSNTEMFAEGYRRMGLGTVVGRPTAGEVIGTINVRLIDDSRFRLPFLKIATPEGEDLEGRGRTVDVDVALPLGATASGRDTQLDAASEVLLRQLDEAAVQR